MASFLHACLSDPGERHRDNEDRYFADPAAGLFLVADGMADAVSPQLVVDWLPGLLKMMTVDDPLDDPKTLSVVHCAIRILNDRIYTEARQCAEMIGTTLVLALIRRGTALVAHLGDSRAYLWREGTLVALTRDHSRVREMLDTGELESETLDLRRWNGGPTRFVGMARTPEADIRLLALLPADRLLLCSDGLTGELDDEAIRAVLGEPWPPERTCQELVDRANAAGGHDNVTVLVIAAGPEGGAGG